VLVSDSHIRSEQVDKCHNEQVDRCCIPVAIGRFLTGISKSRFVQFCKRLRLGISLERSVESLTCGQRRGV
jgi:hypothetical protein